MDRDMLEIAELIREPVTVPPCWTVIVAVCMILAMRMMNVCVRKNIAFIFHYVYIRSSWRPVFQTVCISLSCVEHLYSM